MGDDVQLRDVETADLEAFFEFEQDPEAARRSKFPPREREKFLAHWTSRVLGNPDGFVQAVTVDGEVAGNIVAWTQGDRRFVGYYFGRRFWGRGIGTAALTAFLRREPTRPLYADPYAGNAASIRLLERCGFRRIDVVRDGDDDFVVLVLDG